MQSINDSLLEKQGPFELFNNIGYLDGIEGRLTVNLIMNSNPVINWEFQAVDKKDTDKLLHIQHPQEVISSNKHEPKILVKEISRAVLNNASRKIIGKANKVVFGDMYQAANIFDCYFANADFLRKGLGISSADMDLSDDDFNLKMSWLNEKLSTFKIPDGWSFQFHSTPESMLWLRPKSENRGSKITVRISFSNQSDPQARKSLDEVCQIFYELGLFLSFINGGYITPVCIQAKEILWKENGCFDIKDISAIAIAGLNSPQEEIGISFIRSHGIDDLVKFMECFPRFQSMLGKKCWREKWLLILEWYFQSIPRLQGRRRNTISIVLTVSNENNDVLISIEANILGSLLENLARIILIEDSDVVSKSTFKKWGPRERIDNLVTHIGIQGEDSDIEKFYAIRNNSTHAVPRPSSLRDLGFDEQSMIIRKAIQWVDEAILAKIGYTGSYLVNRASKLESSIGPRFSSLSI